MSKGSSKTLIFIPNRYFRANYQPKEPKKVDSVDEVLAATFPIQEVKLVIVVREDLKMTKGKIGA